MAKKSSRKIINNIDNVNIEIDYDKLAEAIVKSNEKQANQYSVSREWMKFIISPAFVGIAIVSGILAIICIVYGYRAFVVSNTDLIEFLKGIFLFVTGLFLISVCCFTILSVKELNNESDKNFVASIFSNAVALVALIISLIALVG